MTAIESGERELGSEAVESGGIGQVWEKEGLHERTMKQRTGSVAQPKLK